MSERQEAGKRILSNINDAIDNELLEVIGTADFQIVGVVIDKKVL